MKKRKHVFFIGVALSAMALLTVSGCGSDDPVYNQISANVSGLGSDSVVLQNNGGDDLTVSTDGTPAFVTKVIYGAGYHVTVKTQPSDRICVAASPSGTATAAVTVTVNCSARATVTGTLEDSNSGDMLGGVAIEARNPVDDSVLSSATTQNSVTGILGHYSINVPTGYDFYLHAKGRNVDGTDYTSANLQIGKDSDYTGTVKFYYTRTSDVNTLLPALGFSTADAVFSMDVEDSSGNGIAGVAVTADPGVSNIEYKQSDGSFSITGPTTTYNASSVIGNVAAPGGNATYTFTLSPAKTSGGAYDYTIGQSFKLRLIPGELSGPIEP